MSALSQKPRSRRRKPGFSVLAFVAGRSERTIRRWIVQRPDLRRWLRVRRVGKQWRVQLPETLGGREAWEDKVRRIAKMFERTPRKVSNYVAGMAKFLGYGSAERDRDIALLRSAMLLKRLDADLRKSPEDEEVTLTDFSDWEREADNLCGVARILSSKFNCRVEHAPRHWRDDKRSEQWAELWPEAHHWKRAKEEAQQGWLLKTLGDAAQKVANQGKAVVGRNLARFVFRDTKAEHCWKCVQFIDDLRSRGFDLLPPGVSERKYAKRGISLREFRNRYDRGVIKRVRGAVQGDALTTAVGMSEGSKLDAAEIQDMTILDERFKPVSAPAETKRGTVEHDAHRGRNGRAGVSKGFQKGFDGQWEEQLALLSPEELSELEKVVGPLDAYRMNLDKVIPKKPRKGKLRTAPCTKWPVGKPEI